MEGMSQRALVERFLNKRTSRPSARVRRGIWTALQPRVVTLRDVMQPPSPPPPSRLHESVFGEQTQLSHLAGARMKTEDEARECDPKGRATLPAENSSRPGPP
ncbi:hypothetical protein AOLI_G00268420 [Acnodon oligacanthus]